MTKAKKERIRRLYNGDNLAVMAGLPSSFADLIYLDPPFNSERIYEGNLDPAMGKQSFSDIWRMSDINEDDLRRMERVSGDAHDLIWTLGRTRGESWQAYLTFMAVRLDEMRRLLKPTGAIYLHCDHRMNAPLRILMDIMFGEDNLRGEITWRSTSGGRRGNQYASKTWGANKDTILCYAKTARAKLNPLRPLTKEEADEKFNFIDEKTGERYYDDSSHIFRAPGRGARPNLCYEWRGFKNPHPSGWAMTKERLEEEYQKGNFVIAEDGKLQRRKYEKDYEGAPFGSVWADINPAAGKERTGWATQKPLALLARIIKASSAKGDLVIDPFCGCATACVAAEQLGRQWIGIDQHPAAAEIMKKRAKEDTLLAPVWSKVEIIDARRAADLPRRGDVPEIDKTDMQIKQKFYARQKGKCNGGKFCLSGGGEVNIRHLAYDRINPGKRGGYYTEDNVQLLCGACNSAKGGKTWTQFIRERKRQMAQAILDDPEVPGA